MLNIYHRHLLKTTGLEYDVLKLIINSCENVTAPCSSLGKLLSEPCEYTKNTVSYNYNFLSKRTRRLTNNAYVQWVRLHSLAFSTGSALRSPECSSVTILFGILCFRMIGGYEQDKTTAKNITKCIKKPIELYYKMQILIASCF